MITGMVTHVATDSDVLINFLHVDRMDLLGALPGHRFTVPVEVDREITDPAQRERFEAGLGKGLIDKCRADELRELEIYAELPATLGPGERACIALAENRGWSVASDDRTAANEAARRLGGMRVLNTPQTMLMAIRAGTLTVQEADRIKLELEQRRRFKMAFGSFQKFFPPSAN
jgi:hypothetical protein